MTSPALDPGVVHRQPVATPSGESTTLAVSYPSIRSAGLCAGSKGFVESGSEVFTAHDVVAWAFAGVFETCSSHSELLDLVVEFGDLVVHQSSPPVGSSAADEVADLREGEPGSLAQRDHGKPFDDVIVVLTSQPDTAGRFDEADLFVVMQRRRRHSGRRSHFSDVHGRRDYPLDLRFT